MEGVQVVSDKRVETVLGGMPAEGLGVTLPHEHMFLDLRFPNLEQDDPTLRERLSVARMDDLEGAIADLRDFQREGGTTVVELTTGGMGRSATHLAEVAKASGVNIICATGFYAREFHDNFVDTESVCQLRDRMLAELQNSIDGTPIRAGVIKLGSSCFPLTGNELKCFRAGAEAQIATGVAITTHTSAKVAHALASGTMGFEQLDVFERIGVEPGRVIIGHVDINPKLENLIALAKRGAYVEIDGIGNSRNCTDEDRAHLVANLFERGVGHRVLVSQDLARVSRFRSRGGSGYGYLLRAFVPLLKNTGLGEQALRQLLITNPATAFGTTVPMAEPA